MHTLVLLAAALILAGCNAYAAGDMRAFTSPFEARR
jgi:hypothetical protein